MFKRRLAYIISTGIVKKNPFITKYHSDDRPLVYHVQSQLSCREVVAFKIGAKQTYCVGLQLATKFVKFQDKVTFNDN